ncbi:hypothetical protein L4D09_28005 [Photobacterium makurazakiensis]|uniref:hypothetical protein n=1 Tax=Photobacterium makurazakiensis TaxID=2910234 RepID=UPI003D0F2E8C
MKMMIFLLSIVLSANTLAQEVAWTGMKTDKLIAISEQGDKGFQYAMLYILGVVDGMEGQRAINQEVPCRVGDAIANQDITSKVLETLKQLGHHQEPAGKLVIHAYIKTYCEDFMYK